MAIIDNLAPSKNKSINGTRLVDAQIIEKINEGDNVFKKLKNLTCMSIKITIRKQGMGYKN